jgi:hypothetical protein
VPAARDDAYGARSSEQGFRVKLGGSYRRFERRDDLAIQAPSVVRRPAAKPIEEGRRQVLDSQARHRSFSFEGYEMVPKSNLEYRGARCLVNAAPSAPKAWGL